MKKMLKNRYYKIGLCACALILFGSLFSIVNTKKNDISVVAASIDPTKKIEKLNEEGGEDRAVINNSPLSTTIYEIPDNQGYDVSMRISTNNRFKKPFASINLVAPGGEIYKSLDKNNGFDNYGFVVGDGELVPLKDPETGKDMKDDDGKTIYNHVYVGLKIKYNYSSLYNLRDNNGKVWNISNDSYSGEKFNNFSYKGIVGKGVLLVQKFIPYSKNSYPVEESDWTKYFSYDGENITGLYTSDYLSYFGPDKNEDLFIYTPSGDELAKGVYLRVTFGYEIVSTSGSKNEYLNIVEQTTFYLSDTSGEISFDNLTFTEEITEETVESNEMCETGMQHYDGKTLENHSSSEGFTVRFNCDTYDVSYNSNNANSYKTCYDGDTFTMPGYYVFRIKTKTGLVKYKTVYIHEQGIENNIRTYFGNSLFSEDSIRTFNPIDEFPTFVLGHLKIKTATLNDTLIKHAPLTGRVYLINDDWNVIERDDRGFPLSELIATKSPLDDNWSFDDFKEVGNYEAIFATDEAYFNGKCSGDVITFVWRFSILPQAYAPSINEELLDKQYSILDFEPKHYEVKLPSAGKGSFVFCYTSFENACDFARDYLIGTVSSENNVFKFNEKRYTNEQTMLDDLYIKAKSMVEIGYFVAGSSDYLTLKANLAENEEYENILDFDLQKDVYVLSGAYHSDFVSDKAYLNDRIVYTYDPFTGVIEKKVNSFVFLQIDECESKTVTISMEDGSFSKIIPYQTSVGDFLSNQRAMTGKYKITEKNALKESIYYAYYIADGDIATVLDVEWGLDGNITERKITKENDNLNTNANYFRLKSAKNEFDPYGLVRIYKDNNLIGTYQLDEIHDLAFSNCGSYNILINDRFNNSYCIYVNIFEEMSYHSLKILNRDGSVSFTKTCNYRFIKALDLNPGMYANMTFNGWIDQDGNVYNGSYVFDCKKDVVLRPYYVCNNVSVYVTNGITTDYVGSGKVGQTLNLGSISCDSEHEIYGFKYVDSNGKVKIYKGEISSLPNVETIILEVLFVKHNQNVVCDDPTKLYLIDGQINKIVNLEKNQKLSLNTPYDNKLSFKGWLYEYELNGVIFNKEFSYSDIEQAGFESGKPIVLHAIWGYGKPIGTVPVVPTISSNVTGITASGKQIGVGMITFFAGLMLFSLGALFFNNKKKQFYSCSRYNEENETKKIFDFKPMNYERRTKIKKRAYRLVTFAMSVAMIFTVKNIDLISKETPVNAETDISQRIDSNYDEFNEIDNSYASVADSAFENFDVPVYDEETKFLIDNVIIDLFDYGYADVFEALAVTKDGRKVYGLGFSSYYSVYDLEGKLVTCGDEVSNYVFGAGFISLNSIYEPISANEFNDGVNIYVDPLVGNDYEYHMFKLSYDNFESSGHYVAFGNYFTYEIKGFSILYSKSPNKENFDDSLGSVYNYDTGKYCHYADYGMNSISEVYSLDATHDFNYLYETYLGIANQQLLKAVDVEIKSSVFISKQALDNYAASAYQDETLLGYDSDILKQYSANVPNTQYYIITTEGIQVLDLPPDPSTQATIWERIAAAAIAVGAIVIGVCGTIYGGPVGAIVGGALISAAMDLFMQVTVGGASFKSVDWKSVIINGSLGAVSGCIGAASSAIMSVAKNLVVKIVTKIGEVALSSIVNSSVTYLYNTVKNGGELSFKDCMKAVGINALSSAIMCAGGSLISSSINKSGAASLLLQIGGSGLVSGASYIVTTIIRGEKIDLASFAFAVGMGVFSSAIAFGLKKLIGDPKIIKEQRSIKKNLKKLDNIFKDEKKMQEFMDKLPTDQREKLSSLAERITSGKSENGVRLSRNSIRSYQNQLKGKLLEFSAAQTCENAGLKVNMQESAEVKWNDKDRTTYIDVTAKNETKSTIYVFGEAVEPGGTICIECKNGGANYLKQLLGGSDNLQKQLAGHYTKTAHSVLLTSGYDKETIAISSKISDKTSVLSINTSADDTLESFLSFLTK